MKLGAMFYGLFHTPTQFPLEWLHDSLLAHTNIHISMYVCVCMCAYGTVSDHLMEHTCT